MSVNPLTFIGNSSIIDSNRFQNPTAEQELEIKKEFAKLFIEKIYMNRMSLGEVFKEEEEEDLFQGIFSNEISQMIIDDIFRQQITQQIIEDGILDIGLGE